MVAATRILVLQVKEYHYGIIDWLMWKLESVSKIKILPLTCSFYMKFGSTQGSTTQHKIEPEKHNNHKSMPWA